jgi:para-aminobenzoate synthetase
MKSLLIDNYDSFTYNLFHLIARVNLVPPVVIRNDDEAQWKVLSPDDFDCVVLSPGPGHPARQRDFGLCAEVLRDWPLPVLGVCLGHQGLCHLLGGTVDRAPEPVHGRLSDVYHHGVDLFADIPTPFAAVRYHSLRVHDLPEDLDCTAWTEDGLIMGVRHTKRPQWGVQFHPESIATEHGEQLMRNFRRLAAAGRRPGRPVASLTGPACVDRRAGSRYELRVRELPGVICPERGMRELFDGDCRYWLDSSLLRPGLSRFSFAGGAGPLGELVTYDMHAQRVTVRHGATTTTYPEDLWSYLDRQLRRRAMPPADLPFQFDLGYVGYLGYEMKGDCGAQAPHHSGEPDAALLFSDRAIAIDHDTNRCWALCLATAATSGQADAWLARAAALARAEGARARGAGTLDGQDGPGGMDSAWDSAALPMGEIRHGLAEYRDLIAECQRQIAAGETYEVCLTNMISYRAQVDPVTLYRALRAFSPAPYASLLRFPGLDVLSSSPERFLLIDQDGTVESKPIKGTRRRARAAEDDQRYREDLRSAEKDRAENLMIVDLVRNDLGRVCELGSVHVPVLFGIESYRTVHHMVSTVRGTLDPRYSAVDCVRAAFPGGSMTGAPKLRTMQIIDRLEGGPRGVYSGTIGYFALGGAVDLAMVIRTMVVRDNEVKMGVGGAITALSDPDDEVMEMLLKAEAMRRALLAVGVEGSDLASLPPGTMTGVG